MACNQRKLSNSKLRQFSVHLSETSFHGCLSHIFIFMEGKTYARYVLGKKNSENTYLNQMDPSHEVSEENSVFILVSPI